MTGHAQAFKTRPQFASGDGHMEKFTVVEGVAAPLKMINVDTDAIIPKQYLKTIKRTGLGAACSRKSAIGTTAAKTRISCSTSRPIARQNLGRGRQFRLRLLARARPVGAPGFRYKLRDLDLVRRYLLQQLFQERRAADQGKPRGPGQTVRRCRARRQCAPHRRSRKTRNPRPRRRHDKIRHRSAPQALPAQGLDDIGLTLVKRTRSRASRKAKAARPWV